MDCCAGNSPETPGLSHRRLARIEVKAKQGAEWPACRGISGKNAYLVFVDYFKKSLDERPDFYVLSAKEWNIVVHRLVGRYRAHHPGQQVKIRD
jgi:hypothetical protein